MIHTILGLSVAFISLAFFREKLCRNDVFLPIAMSLLIGLCAALLSHGLYEKVFNVFSHRIELRAITEIKRQCDKDKHLILIDTSYTCKFKARLPK